MKKINEMRIEKRLITGFIITTIINSIAVIAAVIVLLIISNRYTYALRYYGFPQGDIGRAMIKFTDSRGDTRGIVGYDTQDEINDMISQYNDDKDEFISLWEAVEDKLVTDESRNTCQTINDKLTVYWKLNEEIIELGKNVNDESSRQQAQYKAMNELAPAYEEIEGLIYELLNTKTSKGDSLDNILNITSSILVVVVVNTGELLQPFPAFCKLLQHIRQIWKIHSKGNRRTYQCTEAASCYL